MNTISQYVSYIADQSPLKIVISKPASKSDSLGLQLQRWL